MSKLKAGTFVPLSLFYFSIAFVIVANTTSLLLITLNKSNNYYNYRNNKQ
jgi:hypothetical protein